MAHPLKDYARHVQRNVDGPRPSYNACLHFVQDYLELAKIMAFNHGRGMTAKEVLVRMWNSGDRPVSTDGTG